MHQLFADSAWPGLIIFLGSGIASYLMWDQFGKKQYFAGVVISIFGILASFAYDYLNITPREEVEISVKNIARECEANNINGVISYIHPNEIEIQDVVRTGMNLITVQPGLRITDLKVTMENSQTGEISKAVSHFRANGTITFQKSISSHVATRWNITWEKNAQGWKVIDISRLDPITGKEIGTLDQSIH